MAEFFAVPALIRQRVSTSMRALTGPVIDRGVEGDMPLLLKVVDEAIAAGPMRECLHAGLWLLADDLGRAHKICQEIQTPYGAGWHAVVHRREGDFWNSKYWWRQARGVKFTGLTDRIRAELNNPPAEIVSFFGTQSYDPVGLVDLMERFMGRPDFHESLVTVQGMEWTALFEECWSTVTPARK